MMCSRPFTLDAKRLEPFQVAIERDGVIGAERPVDSPDERVAEVGL